MCRLLVFACRPGKVDLLLGLADALVEASRSDPLLAEASGATSHGDGWGYAIAALGDEGLAVRHYVSARPIWLEADRLRAAVEELKAYRGAVGVVHARRAGKEGPRGGEHSHPYGYRVEGALMFFAHNGGMDKASLASRLGLSDLSKVTDSYLAGLMLARLMERGLSVEEAYRELAPYTKTALDTGLILAATGRLEAYASAHVASGLSEARLRYYEVHYAEDEGVAAAMSSTVSMVARGRGVVEARPAEWGSLLRLSVDGGVEVAPLRGGP
ncbi:hypothetical protein B6U99_07505 [Candidatus Geothermarchaeota archaeon ex4572_27]|nr:MAG: hypothetical protein B6U99_07505 [Candidatus Geothermarchaeota archaeon ex4572_27]